MNETMDVKNSPQEDITSGSSSALFFYCSELDRRGISDFPRQMAKRII